MVNIEAAFNAVIAVRVQFDTLTAVRALVALDRDVAAVRFTVVVGFLPFCLPRIFTVLVIYAVVVLVRDAIELVAHGPGSARDVVGRVIVYVEANLAFVADRTHEVVVFRSEVLVDIEAAVAAAEIDVVVDRPVGVDEAGALLEDAVG